MEWDHMVRRGKKLDKFSRCLVMFSGLCVSQVGDEFLEGRGDEHVYREEVGE